MLDSIFHQNMSQIALSMHLKTCLYCENHFDYQYMFVGYVGKKLQAGDYTWFYKCEYGLNVMTKIHPKSHWKFFLIYQHFCIHWSSI